MPSPAQLKDTLDHFDRLAAVGQEVRELRRKNAELQQSLDSARADAKTYLKYLRHYEKANERNESTFTGVDEEWAINRNATIEFVSKMSGADVVRVRVRGRPWILGKTMREALDKAQNKHPAQP